MLRIEALSALEVLDSRGNPTVAVTLSMLGHDVTTMVPSGASTGKSEAVELRDGDPGRYQGKGVCKAVRNVEEVIAPALLDRPFGSQEELDRFLIELDGTPDKSRLGANAILGVSCAYARAVSQVDCAPLWASLRTGVEPEMPVPMVNILSGGLHAGRQIEVQDFLVIPHGFASLAESLEAVAAIHRETRVVLERRGFKLTGVADEGGWGPALESNETALEILTEVIARPPFRDKVTIAIDVASSHFFRGGDYELASERRRLTREQMIGLLETWVERYPVVSIEDGLDEDDWDGWVLLTKRLGERVQLIGDDLFTTNPARLMRGVELGAANSVLVKMNQIGTITETLEVLRIARESGYAAVVSARSGETEDSFIADLAVASGVGQIKIGSITRSERLAKYNRLLEIEARELNIEASDHPL